MQKKRKHSPVTERLAARFTDEKLPLNHWHIVDGHLRLQPHSGVNVVHVVLEIRLPRKAHWTQLTGEDPLVGVLAQVRPEGGPSKGFPTEGAGNLDRTGRVDL